MYFNSWIKSSIAGIAMAIWLGPSAMVSGQQQSNGVTIDGGSAQNRRVFALSQETPTASTGPTCNVVGNVKTPINIQFHPKDSSAANQGAAPATRYVNTNSVDFATLLNQLVKRSAAELQVENSPAYRAARQAEADARLRKRLANADQQDQAAVEKAIQDSHLKGNKGDLTRAAITADMTPDQANGLLVNQCARLSDPHGALAWEDSKLSPKERERLREKARKRIAENQVREQWNFVPPVQHKYVKINACPKDAVPQSPIVLTPSNYAELQERLNHVDMPEDVRAYLKSIAILNKYPIDDNLKTVKKELKRLRKCLRNPFETSQKTMLLPIGTNGGHVSMMYFSNTFSLSNDFPAHLPELTE